MTCGFLEVPGNIVKETKEQGAIGVPVGLALGVGMLVARELVGVYEFVTAPFPLPAGYQPILRPEYPLVLLRIRGPAEEPENYSEDTARVRYRRSR